MAMIKDLFQTADYKVEKYASAIEALDKIKKVKNINITVSVGKQISHPNTTDHHIQWIEVYFHPQGEKFPYQLGKFEFTSHGESVQGPNTSYSLYPTCSNLSIKTDKLNNPCFFLLQYTWAMVEFQGFTCRIKRFV